MSNPTIRPFQWRDLSTLVEMLNAAAAADDDEFRYSEAELRHQFEPPGYEPEANVFVAVTPAGQLVGCCDAIPQSDYGEWAWGAVHPDFRRQGIGTALIHTADSRLRQRFPGQPVAVERIVDDRIYGALKLLESVGYAPMRAHYAMRKDLDTPLSPPLFPAGITVRPFDLERDGRAVHAAHQDAFHDHWGHIDEPYELWMRYKTDDPHFDPTLWVIAMEGDEIAGLTVCRQWDAQQADLGHVDELGVRQPWRKRGLGLALLHYSFYLLQQRGFKRVRLGVDAQSTTNAVALYERAGMYLHKRYVIYRRVYS